MRYGLTDDTIAQIINALAKTIKIEKVILFGSRAMGNFRGGLWGQATDLSTY
jgi:predicted nucleotidyltransferase